MIVRQHRFHGHNSLRHVYRGGQTVRDASVALRFMPNSRRKNFRVAVVVSRKVSKSAVVRNRIRRRLYELVRHYQAQITEPYDLVFTIFSDQVASMPATKLDRLVHDQLVRASVLGSIPKNQHVIVEKKEA